MKTLKVALCVGGALVSGLVVCLLVVSQAISAQGDPFIGTWKLNGAKSTFSPGLAPQSQTSIYEAAGQGVKVSTTATDAAGKTTTMTFTANYDGKDYPVMNGTSDWDMTALKRVDTYTAEFTRKKAGNVVQTDTNVVSRTARRGPSRLRAPTRKARRSTTWLFMTSSSRESELPQMPQYHE